MITNIKTGWKNFRRDKPEISAGELAEKIVSVRTHSEIIAITGKPYGNNWRGVYNASSTLFPGQLITIPHISSQNLYSKKELLIISNALVESRFEKIIFSGFGDCLRAILLLLHERAGESLKKNILLIYHGSLSQQGERKRDDYLKEIIEYQQQGILGKIGFVKKGMSETIDKINGIKTQYLINITNTPESLNPVPPEGLHLGVFTHNSFRKNLHNQVAAALMFARATVHVHDDYGFAYLQSSPRMSIHPFSESYDEFLKILGSMTLNFYVTFSECYGLVMAESLSLGVPCLASWSSGFFDYDETLRKSLVVEDFDNSESIYKKAQEVLENRNEIVIRGKEYVKKLNRIAAEKLITFLNE